jgi:hypothetical protein
VLDPKKNFPAAKSKMRKKKLGNGLPPTSAKFNVFSQT